MGVSLRCVLRGGAVLLAVLCAAPAFVGAAPASTDELLRVVNRPQPTGRQGEEWRELRREAVRELGRRKERQAVPALLNIVHNERFDVILEIAIEALGNIGDQRAVTPLEKLRDDPSLDAYVRDAITNALDQLRGPGRRASVRGGANAQPETAEPAAEGSGEGQNASAARSGLTGAFAAFEPLRLKRLEPDTLALVDQLELSLTQGQIRWDGWTDRSLVNLGGGARYFHQLETPSFGYTLDGLGQLGYGWTSNSVDKSARWQFWHQGRAVPEARYYPFKSVPLFVQAGADIGYGIVVGSPSVALDRRFSAAATTAAAGGLGYGRIYDIGSLLRLRRIEALLREEGVLSESLPHAAKLDILRIWYHLRNHIGNYESLGHLLRVLEARGLLAHMPDPSVTYRIIRILDDPQLDQREHGLLVRVGYGYTYELVRAAEDVNYGLVYGTARLQLQRGVDEEFNSELRSFWSHSTNPHLFDVELKSHYTWFLYGDNSDPLGAMRVSCQAGLGSQLGGVFSDGGIGYQVLAGAGYQRYFTRGSYLALDAQGGADRRGGIFLLTLSARFANFRGSIATAEAPTF